MLVRTFEVLTSPAGVHPWPPYDLVSGLDVPVRHNSQ